MIISSMKYSFLNLCAYFIRMPCRSHRTKDNVYGLMTGLGGGGAGLFGVPVLVLTALSDNVRETYVFIDPL